MTNEINSRAKLNRAATYFKNKEKKKYNKKLIIGHSPYPKYITFYS